MRTFAQRRRQQNLLVDELSRLLEPSPEFIRLAIRNIETRYLTPNVVDSWKPVLKAAIGEWAKQQRLSSVLGEVPVDVDVETPLRRTRAIETTQAELDGFATIQRLLGPDRHVEYEDTASYFKIHLPGKPFWAVCRLVGFGDRQPSVWVRLPLEQVKSLVPSLHVTPLPKHRQWSRIPLDNCEQVQEAGAAIRAAWDAVSAVYGSGVGDDEGEGEAEDG